ncbi:hypothetical protein PENTCL1PPCAC_28783, partial [Pristionchus entomophagus]
FQPHSTSSSTMVCKMMTIFVLALLMGTTSAGLLRPSIDCDRMQHVVALHFIAPIIADIGRCPSGCEIESYAPITTIYESEDGEIVNEENQKLVIESCRPKALGGH